mgnify:CR=1 FL=1
MGRGIAQAGGRLGATQFEATCKCNFAYNYPYAIGPRLGVAYQIAPKTVLRGGFGVVYAPVGVNNGTTANSTSFGTTAFDQALPVTFANAMTTLRPVWPGFDPANKPFTVSMSNSGGQIFSFTLPAGSLVDVVPTMQM